MPRTPLEEPLPDGDPALLHGDPDLRPGQLDGLIVDGQDPFAARRRLMREMHDGPDPAPPPARVRRDTPSPRQETPMPTQDPARSPAPNALRVLSPAEWDALPGGRYSRTPALIPAVEALALGKCISVAAEPKRVAATRQALRKLAKERGLTLEIRSGPDYVAARVVEGPTVITVGRPS